MKKLSESETQQIGLLKKGRSTALRAYLLQLAVGEAVHLHYDEWKAVRLPYEVAKRLQKSHQLRFDYGRHPDGTGWVFKRVE